MGVFAQSGALLALSLGFLCGTVVAAPIAAIMILYKERGVDEFYRGFWVGAVWSSLLVGSLCWIVFVEALKTGKLTGLIRAHTTKDK